jgi:hypothetical protein
MTRHTWRVDVNLLGDPVPERTKDLEVFYSDLSEPIPRLRRAYIPADSNGRVLALPGPDDVRARPIQAFIERVRKWSYERSPRWIVKLKRHLFGVSVPP